ncbi:hypothetical protein BCR32DRAFT_289711 [Anaeromyces robustus]|uniref:G-protein coupled receptors family 3 profile domain-containing protein n=1 Tax=Anaeromyces robustus TaxID=1754192 RepID=A0A1Y1XNK8_9FUNG|nr:hypothetical protein BCR32DRAFT_289711 [Anaeromyces robustus]|eukprot:ORX86914.1 hypothetical protein BCR32DRAFT_289711 [Anaeromyces robustus]
MFINALDLPIIYGHFKDGRKVELCKNQLSDCIDVADSYTVGEGSEEFLLWTPFGEPGKAGEHVGNILARALRDLVMKTRDPKTQKDTIRGRIEVVSWSDMAYIPICQKDNPKSPCPTAMILGTTQFAYRSKHGDIKILDDYFDSYLNETHEPLTDSFLKQVYYDYYIDTHFMAVPLILDTRILYFNRTTFNTLNLNYPPPYGQWGSDTEPYYVTWNWEQFVQYINVINANFPNNHAFTFTGQYDEEMKLFNMIIRNYLIETIDSSKNCGFLNNKEKVVKIIENIVKPLFSQLGDEWYPDNEDTINFLNNKTDISPEDLPKICCRDTSIYSNGFLGLTIDSPNSMRKVKLFSEDPTSEIAAGYVPGTTSYLGGSGVAISNYVSKKMQDYAWELILMLINDSSGYLTELGIATNMMPPYDSLYDIRYWNDQKWDVPKAQIRHSIQIQYPRESFPEFGELEDRHPIRLMMLEILKKNIEPSEAVERCCKLMNSVLAGICSDDNWTYTLGECANSHKRKITFSFVKLCKDGTPLPKERYVSCSYVSHYSRTGGSMVIFSVIGIIISLIYMGFFFYFRKSEPIKKAPLNYSIIAILGSILNYLSVIFNTGYPNEFKCIMSKWFLIIGLGLSFGGFTVKLKKVYEIFKSHGIQLNNNFSSDLKLYRIMVSLVLLNVFALIFWTSFNSPIVSSINESINVNTRSISYDVIKCTSFFEQNLTSVFFTYIFNIITLLYGVWLSFKTWRIPQNYSETKFDCTSIFISAFSIIIAIPLLWVSHSNYVHYLIKSLVLNFVTAIAISVYCVPKIRSAYYYTKVILQKKESNTSLVNHSDKILGSVICPSCGALLDNSLFNNK